MTQTTEEDNQLSKARQELLRLSDGQLHQFKPLSFNTQSNTQNNTHQQSLNQISQDDSTTFANKTQDLFNPKRINLNTINESV